MTSTDNPSSRKCERLLRDAIRLMRSDHVGVHRSDMCETCGWLERARVSALSTKGEPSNVVR